ncbi:MAG: cytochrome c3 family protein [Bacteroidetes bacterium]|nr:cytochrome c3 family protein [Bacteroidota bacterium]
MKTRLLSFLLGSILIIGAARISRAQSNDDCLACHSDSTLTMQSKGKTVSLYVNPDVFKSSVHGDAGLSCVDCHQGFSADDVPHKQTTPNVSCDQCHDVQLHAPKGATYHMAHSSLQCWECHGTHNIKAASKLSSVNTCLKCHKAQDSFLASAHAKTEHDKSKMTCETCHSKAHYVKNAAALAGSAIDSLCSQCHQGVAEKIASGIHKAVFGNGTMTCVTCHTAHHADTSKEVISKNACFKCHTNYKLFKGINADNGEPLTSLVESYQHSIHAESLKKTGKGATCVDCHGSHTIKPPSDPTSPVNRANIVATCGKCHADIEAEYLKSSHGQAYKKGLAVAPVCTDCHTEHSIASISSPKSPVSRQNEPKICLSCHLGNPTVLKMVGLSHAFLESIRYSVHLVALEKGNLKAATCSDCHGAHAMLPAGNPNSRVFRNNIPKTCGQSGCHTNVEEKYFEGIHGKALLNGNNGAPVCTSCHGDHQILAPNNPQSTVSGNNIVQVCSSCHGSVKLTQRYGLPSHSVGSYLDSYHGLAKQGGMTTVANCASCHGAHEILPSSDPNSPINGANLARTCGKCHPGADAKFAAFPVHVAPTRHNQPLLFWISQIYAVLIIGTIGLMFLHNVFDFAKKARHKLQVRRGTVVEHVEVSKKLYTRMTKPELLQHWGLFVSFTMLVITGFMLKFPDSWWVRALREIGGGGERMFELRSLIHRISAVLLIATALYHVYYVAFAERGRQFIKDMLPKLKDARDIVGIVKYYLGLSNERPKFDRFSYIEKAEYWALIWGTTVMVTTGLLLWFNTFTVGTFTLLGIDVATLIHYYEAILATLAILVWHMYFVMLNPDVYPMNLSWLFGTITEEEMLEEHPLELQRLREEEERPEQIIVQNGNGPAGKDEDEKAKID